jgi:uncharacterized protein (DUF1800 family)
MELSDMNFTSRAGFSYFLFRRLPLLLAAAIVVGATPVRALDRNHNSFDDVWELVYNAGSLAPLADTDGDGYSNAEESAAGTDPRDPASHPQLRIAPLAPGLSTLSWPVVAGKRYHLLSRSNLLSGSWEVEGEFMPNEPEFGATTSFSSGAKFFRLSIDDTDSDGDGLTDYEERSLGLNAGNAHTDRFVQTDFQRTTNAMSTASTVTISALDPLMSERWPDPGLVVVRRKGGIAPLNVGIALSGTATPSDDYVPTSTTNVFIPVGVREVWIQFQPVADSVDNEPAESIVVTLQPGTGYKLGTNIVATLTLENETETSLPPAKAAARFLIQAAFGPDQDSSDDADYIPENVEEVMAVGFSGWIEDQFTRPIGKLQPFVDWGQPRANDLQLYGDLKEYSWWNRVMGAPKLRPDDANPVAPDPLRQRVAFALSEICVISDRPEDLATTPEGMANYYDMLLTHAFGNYRGLLYDVATHPCMGIYLSHLGNRKADPVNRIYPDENFAREIMQLFSIGLWELNSDGTRKLDNQGQPIATYDNSDITELARVFTGLAFGGSNVNFGLWPRDFTTPMKMWDEYHDCDAKTLIRGLHLPARTPSDGNLGTAGLADVNAAVDNLFNHPNVGPFIGRQLIQRFVTSNPSTNYVGRVAAAFADNGSGVRGDMKAVIRAVLLDEEARDPAMMNSPTFGKLREPFLRCVNFARAFNANSKSGIYALDNFTLDHAQEPMKAPSVFNFFLPIHSPPGAITQAGLAAPEFQIINASSSITAPNYFWNAVWNGLNRWGVSNPDHAVTLNLDQELRLVVPAAYINDDVPGIAPYDPDPLLRRLDLTLTGGRMSPIQFQIIRETLERLPRPSWQWHREYLRVAIYLIITSPEFCVLH